MAAMSAQVAGCMQFAQSRAVDDHPGGKIGQNGDAKNDIERFKQRRARDKRGDDDKQDGDQIENQQAVAEADGKWRLRFVKAS